MNANLEGITKIIYVGSIPFDQTEEQVIELFKSAGPVANFKLIFDKDTGKSKGYGFVQYHDTESAKSAVRNLNNYLFGGRNLRVDFASYLPGGSNEINPLVSGVQPASGGVSGAGAGAGVSAGAGSVSTPVYTSSLPQLPTGIALPPGSNSSQVISNIINNYSESNKIQILADFKELIGSNYTMALNLLDACPQLCFALVQDLLALRHITPEQVAGLVRQQPSSKGYSSQSPVPVPVPTEAPNRSTPVPVGTTPPPQHQPPQQQQQQPPPQKLSPQDAEMVRQVLAVTDEQLQHVPEDQRQTILLIRAKFARGELIF